MKKNAQRIGICGASGSGKSTRVLEIIDELKLDRLIVLDPLGDWEKRRGYRVCRSLENLYKALKRDWQGGFKLVLSVDETAHHLPTVLQTLARDLFIIQRLYAEGKDRREITLVIDEMADYFPNRSLSKEEQHFTKLCRKGRHYGVNIIGATQRIAEVHPSFRGNMSHNYYFRQGEAIDVNRALASLGTEYKAQLLGLADHEYLLKTAGKVIRGKNTSKFVK